ncbi:Crotonobetainyl-CoA:carnitine CoA-transferase CaiB [Lishizhenia tianjinensis]|uniref:Crotonobetainyl-CoA:carnitine CoA-transferase CaiB n=1 Tax=Lishizhenia tianjinensis TaxID=477690 RepID=A0A1I7A5D8_9FLAO|nr:CaiB/BaiF CoA-transferase family protein [Lishizhenia tianjinensis]SFT70149.1 Crotonobetainyl-CoA:carnitine CoA-transferase CaiB [Lishizhenia tianjinensis]
MKNFIEQLRVIDLSSVLAGPSVGMFFAELGADVTKIEHPIYKDVTRSWKLASEDKNSSFSAYFSAINYKKKYTSLNLKLSEDVLRLKELIKHADVLLMNFKKGDQEKFNISDDTLLSINPQLIIGKINGYGNESDRVAYDLILQAESGFMSMNGKPDSGPIKMPVALIDVLAGHQLKEGILNALLNRTQTQKGSVVTVSLYETAVASLMNQASNYLMNNHIPQRIGSLHPNIAPYGEIFSSKDDKLLTFAIGNDKQFAKLCNFLELDEIPLDDQFSSNVARISNRTELEKILAAKIMQHDAQEIMNYCLKENIPAGIIQNLKEVFETPLAKAMIREEEIDGKLTRRVSSVSFKTKEA